MIKGMIYSAAMSSQEQQGNIREDTVYPDIAAPIAGDCYRIPTCPTGIAAFPTRADYPS